MTSAKNSSLSHEEEKNHSFSTQLKQPLSQPISRRDFAEALVALEMATANLRAATSHSSLVSSDSGSDSIDDAEESPTP